jgi:hypothetical protein
MEAGLLHNILGGSKTLYCGKKEKKRKEKKKI